MKIVFLWNKSSLNYIKSIEFDNNEKNIITDKVDFDIKNLEKSDFLNIVILVELDWSGNLFGGYTMAHRIIMEWGNDSLPPNIQFVSFLPQLSLYKNNYNINKFYSKSFTHYQLPLIKKISVQHYSISKYQYLKKYALTESGILDKIKHDLEKVITDSNRDFEKEDEDYCQQLRGVTTIIGEKLLHFIEIQTDNKQEKLKTIYTLIVERIRELNVLKGNIEKTYDGVKEKILLLEDNINFGEKIKSALNLYFDVDYYNNGDEAIEAIKINAINYQALVTDLELLNIDGKTDQHIQGIEVFEYVQNFHPHIVKRIVSGLPRNGINELVNVDINDILYKSLIAYYGFTDGFESWVEKLKKDIKLHKELKYMKGPNNTFWKDVEYSFDNSGNKKAKGSGFKRFYYNFKIEDKTNFDEMWIRIYSNVCKILENKDDIKVSTTFPKTISGQDILSKKEKQNTIELLEKILTHRLLWISFFDNNTTVIYRDDDNPEYSFKHRPFWDNNLPVKPTALFTWLGFSSNAENPKNKDVVKDDTKYVSIRFSYNTLFLEEEKFRVKYNTLLKSRISDFAIRFEDLCNCSYWILKKLKENLNELHYSFENYTDIIEDDIIAILNIIIYQHKTISVPNKNDIKNLIIEYMENDDYEKTPKKIYNLMGNIIDKNILN